MLQTTVTFHVIPSCVNSLHPQIPCFIILISSTGIHNFSPVYKMHIFQCLGKIFCVDFQRVPLKFLSKYLIHTLKDVIFIQSWILRFLKFKSSYAFLKRTRAIRRHIAGYNTLRPKQNGRYFADDISKYISLTENFWVLHKISLKYVP